MENWQRADHHDTDRIYGSNRRYESLRRFEDYSSSSADYRSVRQYDTDDEDQSEEDLNRFSVVPRMLFDASPKQLYTTARSSVDVVDKNWITNFNEGNSTSGRYIHQIEPKAQTAITLTGIGGNRDPIYETLNNRNLNKLQIGIFGWKKRVLYLMILLLTCMIVINSYITFWFIGWLQVNSQGMGAIKTLDSGLMIAGVTYFMNDIVASKIRSQPGKPISMVTSDKFTVSITSPDGREMSSFLLSNDSVQFITKALSVTNEKGDLMFSVAGDTVHYGAKEVKISGKHGAVVNEAIETPLVKGHFKENLNLLSIHRSVEVTGSSGVILKAYAGDLIFSCLTGMMIKSIDGSIRMDSRRIFMPNLPIANRTSTSCTTTTAADSTIIGTTTSSTKFNVGNSAVNNAQQNDGGYYDKSKLEAYFNKKYTKIGIDIPAARTVHPQRVYQICMCANGKIFLATANGECAADNESGICR